MDSLINLAKNYNQLIEADTVQELFNCTVSAAGSFTDAELIQLYLLDQSQTALYQKASYYLNKLTIHQNPDIDYYENSLLQFCLTQDKTFTCDNLTQAFLDTVFLPNNTSQPWHSLLILPIHNKTYICGLLVVASYSLISFDNSLLILKYLCQLALTQYPRLLKLQLLEQKVQQPTPTTIQKTTETRTKKTDHQYGLVGTSKAMRSVYFLISKVLHTPYTILLTGETGTGKEVVAKAIHHYSARKTKPFIVQNCASVPESLLESELFGYCKGAFTGADKDFPGIFRQADGGTLFLDEIGDMPLNLQAKLLRVLQENEVRPLGSTKTYKIDVRVIAATHRDLEKGTMNEAFREDLYYRLAQFPIELPPLREREEDIISLAYYFLDKACEFLNRTPCKPTPEFMALLQNYPFPGNVRELKLLLERAILLTDNDLLEPKHLALKNVQKDMTISNNSDNFRNNLKHFERQQLLTCLKQNNGNQTKTAKQLGIARRTLIYKLQRFNISKKELQV